MAFLKPEDQDFSDEELQQLMELGIIPDQQSMMQDQMRMAEKLRYGSMPEMRQGGRVQTAANPLEFLAAGLQGHKAGKQIEELKRKQDEMLQKQVSGRKLFYKGLRQPGIQQEPQPYTDGVEEYL